MSRLIILTLALLLTACSDGQPPKDDANPAVSGLDDDENLVLFRTTGWLDEKNQEWHLPIHGWVYEPEDSTARMALFETILEEQFGLVADDKTESNLARRLNLLIADNERGKSLVATLAGSDYTLPPSAENGHFGSTIVVPVADIAEFTVDGGIEYGVGAATGVVRLVAPAGLSVISDIDDTVKISNVTDKASLLEHTFLLDFIAAPGMADKYREWSASDISFHFVSSSPWQLYSPLTEFLDDSGFPWATLNLKSVRFRDETLFDLFKKGTETKPATIKKILQAYPDREFVLVGDSGEQDPEVYAALIHEFPEQIKKVHIRNVTGETADNERFTTVFAGIETDHWSLFDDPDSLELPSSP
jgi:hypothetical protein